MNLKELAASLGLSQTTVSRALNGYPEVAEATRRRVLDAAARHDYRPNVRARSLATGRAMAIGHVLPAVDQHEILNPVFGDFISGAGETYRRAGYDMVLSIVEDSEEQRTYRDLRARGTVDGLILHAPRMNDPRIEMLREIGLPFVVHGRASGRHGYSWLDVNNRRAFQRAADFLLDLGHRRIALVNGRETMDFAHRRRSGFEAALADRGLCPDPALMRSEDMTESYGHRAAWQMLALPDPPTAFLVSSIICALGVRRAVEERGLAIGRDVSIVTHDDALSYLRNGDEVPVFTATRSSVREAGRLAAEMLLGLVEDPESGPRTMMLEAELTVGFSTGPAPGHGIEAVQSAAR